MLTPPFIGRSRHPPHHLFVNGSGGNVRVPTRRSALSSIGDDAARAHVGLDTAQEIRRVAQVHQDPATDHGVEVAGEVEVVQVAGDELDVGGSHARRRVGAPSPRIASLASTPTT